MEYLEQVEKLYKYFEFNLGMSLLHSVIEMKHNFNNDYNLIGCFLKDYLTVVKNQKIYDEDLYDDFILYFEQEVSTLPKEYVINKIIKYSKYYLSIVFEDCGDSDALIAISTINSCFGIDYYPLLMKAMNKYHTSAINKAQYKILLNSIVDVAIKNFEDYEVLEIQPNELEAQVKSVVREKVTKERLIR